MTLHIEASPNESVVRILSKKDDVSLLHTFTPAELDYFIDRLMVCYAAIAPQGRPVCDRVEPAHG